MNYSTIGVIAVLILLIENQDILLNLNDSFNMPAWKVYRRFLFSVIVYYITDILWGVIESAKLSALLFTDTSIYFIAMAAGILFWTQYVVTYLDENSGFGLFLVHSGRIMAVIVTLLTVLNIFVPVIFTVDHECVYEPLKARYAVLAVQILLLLLISVHAFLFIIRNKNRKTGKKKRYRTMAYFGLIMAVFLFAQIWFPYLPLYAIAYMLGTSLIRALVIRYEREDFRLELEEAGKISKLKQTISALLDNMPALAFSKDAETGVYLACNQSFAEYANKENPEGVIGLTDAEIFDPETAEHFSQDDKMALSMDEPYVFYEDVPDAVGSQRQFQTTKLKYTDAEGKLCILGMGQDVTDFVRIQRENATTKEAYERERSTGLIYTRIVQTLARSYENLYYVNIDTSDYIEYRTDRDTDRLTEVRRGSDFFDSCRKEAEVYVHPDDRDTFMQTLEREAVLESFKHNRTFDLTYRFMAGKDPVYVRMRFSRMEDDESFIIIGITDVDAEMKQRRMVERVREENVAYTRLSALAGEFLCLYIVIAETGRYREYRSTEGVDRFNVPRMGEDFYEVSREQIKNFVYHEDLNRFLSMYTKEGILSEIERNGIFTMSFRLVPDGRPIYVQLKAAIVEESDAHKLIVGINDIDALMRQEEDYARRLAQAQSKANKDALTGVKTRSAYLDEEKRLNGLIKSGELSEFAIVLLDLNDLKKINDTEGHQAGDQYIKDACRIICNTFKRSPVFRVGGDEFTVIAHGDDYECIDELTGKIEEHNSEALGNGGVIIACGLARYENEGSVAPVFERADQKMYEDKTRLKAAHASE
ncbi:MAG: GGDEF domain-containing protein [Lachnospiraceae bacterium]|nr:GGDEF domain-containing protein [Lachnospiraceae bacterium]